MSAKPTALQMPPRRTSHSGEERRVGIELEMSGLTLQQLANAVASELGLQVESSSRYERLLKGDAAGDWLIELDFDLLKKMGRENRDPNSILADIEEAAENLLHWGAEQLVPLEVVSPPLPISRLHEVEALIASLRKQGALGTAGNLLYAFGMQFNPEVPSTTAADITDYLKAFLCGYDWLYNRAQVNLTRRITAYVDPFPKSYVRLVVSPDYQPDISTLIDDYLEHNPTRNRALDMLPLFHHIDESRVLAQVDDPLVKARPTFHYRLPNCEIDRPDWGLHRAWNDWVAIERLAEDKARLAHCCRAYSEHLTAPVTLPGQWLKMLEQQWLA
ncbi:MAG TPA: amidoligase family protein [Cellvibrionaceae bacterium]